MKEGKGEKGKQGRGFGGGGWPSLSSSTSPQRPQGKGDGGGTKRRRSNDVDGDDDNGTEGNPEIYSMAEEDPIDVDDVYVNGNNDSTGYHLTAMRRPASLPSHQRTSDEEHEGGDDFGSIGDRKVAATSMPSELGTEGNVEADSNSRVSLLSDQREAIGVGACKDDEGAERSIRGRRSGDLARG